MTTCPEGMKNDFLMYLPMSPYFEKPRGTDCGMSILGFNIFGSITLFSSIVMFLLLARAALVKKLNSDLRIMMISNCGLMLICMAYVIVGFVAEDTSVVGFYIITCIILYISIISVPMIGKVGIDKIIKTILIMTKQRSLDELFSTKRVWFFKIALAVCLLVYGTACIAMSAYVSRGDFATALICFRVLCCFGAMGVLMAILFVIHLITMFTNSIEKSLAAVRANLHVGQMHSGEKNVSNAAQVDPMIEVIARFRSTRYMLAGTLPAGFGLWICHATILPWLWYVGLLHIFNIVLGISSSFFMFTPVQVRRQVFWFYYDYFGGSVTSNQASGEKKKSSRKENNSNSAVVKVSIHPSNVSNMGEMSRQVTVMSGTDETSQ